MTLATPRIDIAYLRARLLPEAPELPRARTKFYTLDAHAAEAGTLLYPAAVLVPVVARPEPSVLLTRRADHLARHAGQISFPGGRTQPGDASLADTALRETFEETGIDPSFVTIAGYLSPYETGTGYAVQPVVGWLAPDFALRPDPAEVADVFEAPLSFLLDPANVAMESGVFGGTARSFRAIRFGTHYIWGATADMLALLGNALA